MRLYGSFFFFLCFFNVVLVRELLSKNTKQNNILINIVYQIQISSTVTPIPHIKKNVFLRFSTAGLETQQVSNNSLQIKSGEADIVYEKLIAHQDTLTYKTKHNIVAVVGIFTTVIYKLVIAKKKLL